MKPKLTRLQIHFIVIGLIFVLSFITMVLSYDVVKKIMMAVTLLIIMSAIIYVRSYKAKKFDYKSTFTFGLLMLVFGLTSDNNAFLAFGIIMVIAGIVKKEKIKK